MPTIGLDFDNTIVDYDHAFHAAGVETGLVAPDCPAHKQAVRDAIRVLPGGNDRWTRLQAEVYGRRMLEDAQIADGLAECVAWARAAGFGLRVISHKTVHPALGPAYALRTVARQWLARLGLFADDEIVFTDTLEEKLAHIARTRCDFFIDDLPEVLTHPMFPAGTVPMWYTAHAPADSSSLCRCAHWRDIRGLLAATAQLPRPATRIARLRGGANSRVHAITTADGNTVVCKSYRAHRGTATERLAAEFGGLQLLWDAGVRAIPQPLWTDAPSATALYAHIDGTPFTTAQITAHDVEQAAHFFGRLAQLSRTVHTDRFPPASEACFTLCDHAALIAGRAEALQRIDHAPLQDWLATHWRPSFARAQEPICGMPDESLPQAERILSPSDVGFHNILRRADGTLAFLDFEYFGWCDPAKLACDFLLQPGVACPTDLAPVFLRTFQTYLSAPDQFAHRFRLLQPLLALKWCLIVCNPFTLPWQQAHGAAAPALLQERLARAEVLRQRAGQLLREISDGVC